MKNDLRERIVRERVRAIAEHTDAQNTWLCGDTAEERKSAFQRSILLDGYIQALSDVLLWMSENTDVRKGGRPADAQQKLEAYLVEHPDAADMSVRELARASGVGHTTVAQWKHVRKSLNGGGQ